MSYHNKLVTQQNPGCFYWRSNKEQQTRLDEHVTMNMSTTHAYYKANDIFTLGLGSLGGTQVRIDIEQQAHTGRIDSICAVKSNENNTL